MVHIEIHIPRPLLTLALIGGFVGVVWTNNDVFVEAIGGTGTTQASVVHEAEQEIMNLRIKQDVLNRREDILRAELAALEEEEARTKNLHTIAELREARSRLVALLNDKSQAEQEILASLQQIWEAQGYAIQASRGSRTGVEVAFIWPVEPTLGISAHFEDSAYEQRFGMPHHAIDIPVEQGSTVFAAADGVIAKVSDQGMGFSSLVIRHDGGFATMYGHVSAFLVEEGQEVRAGDPVALSGGRPGTAGAGRMTTGAHLHLELIKDGAPVNPLQYLPSSLGAD